MATHHGPQPSAHLGDWGVPASPQLVFDLREFGAQALGRGVPMHDEPSCSGASTHVDEAQKLEGLRLPLASLLPVLGSKAPKLQQARLVRVQQQAEWPEPLPQGLQETLGISALL